MADRCRHPFIDPVSGEQVILHMDPDAPGVEHGACPYRAEVFPELDAFFCRHCTWNGRISGVWFVELLTRGST